MHLFFEYCVAKNIWAMISDTVGLNIGHDFESVVRVANKKHGAVNTVSAGVLWSLCKLRRELCIQGIA